MHKAIVLEPGETQHVGYVIPEGYPGAGSYAEVILTGGQRLEVGLRPAAGEVDTLVTYRWPREVTP